MTHFTRNLRRICRHWLKVIGLLVLGLLPYYYINEYNNYVYYDDNYEVVYNDSLDALVLFVHPDDKDRMQTGLPFVGSMRCDIAKKAYNSTNMLWIHDQTNWLSGTAVVERRLCRTMFKPKWGLALLRKTSDISWVLPSLFPSVDLEKPEFVVGACTRPMNYYVHWPLFIDFMEASHIQGFDKPYIYWRSGDMTTYMVVQWYAKMNAIEFIEFPPYGDNIDATTFYGAQIESINHCLHHMYVTASHEWGMLIDFDEQVLILNDKYTNMPDYLAKWENDDGAVFISRVNYHYNDLLPSNNDTRSFIPVCMDEIGRQDARKPELIWDILSKHVLRARAVGFRDIHVGNMLPPYDHHYSSRHDIVMLHRRVVAKPTWRKQTSKEKKRAVPVPKDTFRKIIPRAKLLEEKVRHNFKQRIISWSTPEIHPNACLLMDVRPWWEHFDRLEGSQGKGRYVSITEALCQREIPDWDPSMWVRTKKQWMRFEYEMVEKSDIPADVPKPRTLSNLLTANIL